jgi:hypothetical protein
MYAWKNYPTSTKLILCGALLPSIDGRLFCFCNSVFWLVKYIFLLTYNGPSFWLTGCLLTVSAVIARHSKLKVVLCSRCSESPSVFFSLYVCSDITWLGTKPEGSCVWLSMPDHAVYPPNKVHMVYANCQYSKNICRMSNH